MARLTRFRWLSGTALIIGLLATGVVAQPGTGAALAQAAPTVQTRAAGNLGTILTGADGKTVYMFDRDTAGTSNCNDACATTWPPLVLASGNPVAPAGLSGTLGVITRADGKRQVTYQDKPLYNYAADTAAGDTKGDGVGGIWHVVKPVAATTTSQPAAAVQPAAAAQPAAAPANAARPNVLTAAGTGGLIGAPSERLFLASLLGIGALGLAAAGTALLRGRE